MPLREALHGCPVPRDGVERACKALRDSHHPIWPTMDTLLDRASVHSHKEQKPPRRLKSVQDGLADARDARAVGQAFSRPSARSMLRSVGLDSQPFASISDFLKSNPPDGPTCLVLDVRLPGESGLDFQRQLAAANRELPIIFITGHGGIPMSVQAMKGGAIERHPTRWPGEHDPDGARRPPPPGYGHRRTALFVPRANDPGGNHRLLALRRLDHCWRRRLPATFRQRTRRRVLPGPACRDDLGKAERGLSSGCA
jgi:CheY-like chemotaxis protein